MAIDWKFKDGAKPQGSSDGFWYDLTGGGYLKLEAVLDDADQLKRAQEAVETLWSLEEALSAADLINEF